MATIDELIQYLATAIGKRPVPTAVGKSLATAADAAAARTALGAGTSSLAVGTKATDAKPGNYAPSKAEVQSAGAATAVKVNGTTVQASGGVVDLGNLSTGAAASPVTYTTGYGPTI